MIDTWATVGSCAQIGKNCHISGGVGIGGVLEPVQAEPVIIEDDCFIGARSEVAEGVIVERGAVLSMGVFLGASTKIVDRATGETLHGPRAGLFRGGAGHACRASRCPTAAPGPSLYCAVIVKRVDEQHPRQDLDQRAAARLMRRHAIDAVDLAAAPDPRAVASRRRMPARFRCSNAALEAAGLRLPDGRVRREPGTAPVLNLYARRGAGGRNFCFAGHTDVVPPGDARRWTRRSVRAARSTDGTLYGRGAADMKSAIACVRRGVRGVPRSARPAFRRLDQLAHHRRRGGRRDQRHAQAAGLAAPRKARRLDACVVGEPTSAERARRHGEDRPARQPQRLSHGARRAGPYRLSASRRQRGAPARRRCCTR